MPSLREPEAPGVGGLRGPTCVPGGSVASPWADGDGALAATGLSRTPLQLISCDKF